MFNLARALRSAPRALTGIRAPLFSSMAPVELPSNIIPDERALETLSDVFGEGAGMIDPLALARSDTSEKRLPVADLEVALATPSANDPDAAGDHTESENDASAKETSKPTIAGEVTLDNAVFGLPIRRDIVHRVVCWQRANRRETASGGLVKVKNRAEVSGGGRKPWKQKGSGRARHGSIRSPIWRGGGKAHGPRPTRDWSQRLNKKIVQLGLKTALSAKWREGNVAVVKTATFSERKTRLMAAAIDAHGWGEKRGVVFVRGMDEDCDNFYWATRNVPNLTVLHTESCNVYDLLRREQLVVTEAALAELSERTSRRPGLWHSGARALAAKDAVASTPSAE
jgi:large subunit ribosomal protein L4